MTEEDPLVSGLKQMGYLTTIVTERTTLFTFNDQMKEVYLVVIKDQVDLYENLEVIGLPALFILTDKHSQILSLLSRGNTLFDFIISPDNALDLEEVFYRVIRLVEQNRILSISTEYHFDFLTGTFRYKNQEIFAGKGDRRVMAAAVLRMLVRNRGKALSKEAIRQYLGSRVSVPTIINNLRVALRDYDSAYLQKMFIQYHKGTGTYTFTGHVLFPQKKALNESTRQLVEEALVKTLRHLPVRRKLKFVLGKVKYILMVDRAGLFYFSRQENKLCQFIGDYRSAKPVKRYDEVEIDLNTPHLPPEYYLLHQYLSQPKEVRSGSYIACTTPKIGIDYCIYIGDYTGYEVYLLVDDLTRSRKFNLIDLEYCREILTLRSVQRLIRQLLEKQED